MGAVDIKNVGLWTDSTQDVVDLLIQKHGYNYEREDYTKAALERIYKDAMKDETLWYAFKTEMMREYGKRANRKELSYHIKFALRMLPADNGPMAHAFGKAGRK